MQVALSWVLGAVLVEMMNLERPHSSLSFMIRGMMREGPHDEGAPAVLLLVLPAVTLIAVVLLMLALLRRGRRAGSSGGSNSASGGGSANLFSIGQAAQAWPGGRTSLGAPGEPSGGPVSDVGSASGAPADAPDSGRGPLSSPALRASPSRGSFSVRVTIGNG